MTDFDAGHGGFLANPLAIEGKRRRSSRASGTNPRAKGTNPRRKGTNPSAGVPVDIARVNRELRRAYARLHARGDVWCTACDDTGWRYATDATGAGRPDVAYPCLPHRKMTTADADLILHPDD